jgi:transcriptional regulator with XRE-family HTH domain
MRRIENGEASPSLAVLGSIAGLLKLSLGALLEGSSRPG